MAQGACTVLLNIDADSAEALPFKPFCAQWPVPEQSPLLRPLLFLNCQEASDEGNYLRVTIPTSTEGQLWIVRIPQRLVHVILDGTPKQKGSMGFETS